MKPSEEMTTIASNIHFIYNNIKHIKEQVGVYDKEAIVYALENALSYISDVDNKAETLKNKLAIIENYYYNNQQF